MSQLVQFTSTQSDASALIADGSNPLAHEVVTLQAGQVLSRGAVLGRIAASGKFVLSTAAATDGSEVPRCVLIENTDASAGDRTALVYVRGDFLETGLVLGAGHTLASIRDVLRDAGIWLVKPKVI